MMDEEFHQRPLLILDLDETLIHSSWFQFKKSDQLITTVCDRDGNYFVYKRPHLEEFLDFCFQHFDVAIWTAASQYYAHRILALICDKRPLIFIYTEKRCTKVRYPEDVFSEFETSCVTIKDLKKVRRRKFAGMKISISTRGCLLTST